MALTASLRGSTAGQDLVTVQSMHSVAWERDFAQLMVMCSTGWEWPNLDVSVALVACERGREQRKGGGIEETSFRNSAEATSALRQADQCCCTDEFLLRNTAAFGPSH